MMFYPSVKFQCNCFFPSKVIDRKHNLAKNPGKKDHNSVKILQITPLFELDLYLMMLDSSVKLKCN